MSGLVYIETNAKDVDRWLTEQSRNLDAAMRDAMKEAEREGLRMYRRTSGTWFHKPDYQVAKEIGPNSITLIFGTPDPIWNMLDKGTRPHVIRPKRAKRLAFQWGGPGSYIPKTQPGIIGSTNGGPTGDTVYRAFVRHPGTEPRRWTIAIEKEMNTTAVKIMRRHLEKWRARR